MSIDLKKEQIASRERPRYKYSVLAKIFFWMMDVITGKKVTPAKAKLIETLASIPYRSWEIRQYARMTRGYRKDDLVKHATGVMNWGRDAQDNEYWHLRVINDKMKQDGIKDAWYLFPLVPWIMVLCYAIITRMMAVINIRRAFLFNAEFEDHAEHVYAQFVDENPGLDDQPVDSEIANEYMEFESWGDVFRRIGLDERDHMNNSFVYCGKPECVVEYEGMPPLPDVTPKS